MLVRTISLLPLVDQNTNYSDGRIEISVPSAGKFTSKAITPLRLSSDIADSVAATVASTYNLDANGSPIDVNALKQDINTLSNENAALSGVKKFTSWPFIPKTASELPTADDAESYENDLGYVIPNVNAVRGMIVSLPAYFSTENSNVAEGLPLGAHKSESTVDTVPESLDYRLTIGSGKFYFWHIDDKDSSKAVYDTRSGTVDAYLTMRDTGLLVVWGWLADNGQVDALFAWVGLFAALKCKDADSTIGSNTTLTYDVPISIKPWIRGQYASTMQYISFNVPVQKGLRLKIKTGFQVNSSAQGGVQTTGTLSFIDRWVPNSFFGYIVSGYDN